MVWWLPCRSDPSLLTYLPQPHKVLTYAHHRFHHRVPLISVVQLFLAAAPPPRFTSAFPTSGAAHHGRPASPPSRRTRRCAATDCTDAQMPRNTREAHGRIEMQVSNWSSSSLPFPRSALTMRWGGVARHSCRNCGLAAWGRSSTMSCTWQCLMR